MRLRDEVSPTPAAAVAAAWLKYGDVCGGGRGVATATETRGRLEMGGVAAAAEAAKPLEDKLAAEMEAAAAAAAADALFLTLETGA